MTTLPPPSKKKLGLVIDLDTCVGCHACAVGCKEWNAGGIADEDWLEVSSHHGSISVQAKFAGNTQPDTVWSWNAIGKRKGAWKLAKDAPESSKGFLLNHLISDITPKGDYANADPVTGQAAWFDLRVSIRKVEARDESAPQFPPLPFGEASEQPLRYGAGLRNAQHRSKAAPDKTRPDQAHPGKARSDKERA